ncbi:MAG: CehA/McbA family metallohydrolase, partial [Limisphaerales bacterium]
CFLTVVSLFCGLRLTAADVPHTTIDPSFYHLGDSVVPQWSEAPADPSGFKLEIRFESKANAADKTLGLTHRDVDDQRWNITLNGKSLGQLQKVKPRRDCYYLVPAGVLKNGENVLRIEARRSQDDITVGGAILYDGTLRDLLNLQPVTFEVFDQYSKKHIPAKITIANANDELVDVHYAESPKTAVRRGIVYTLGDGARLEVPPGRYHFFATRGTEWSLDKKTVEVAAGRGAHVQFHLTRELETKGIVAADTHIHTLTFSGHGDASTEERMVTLAAEGVELAIATDHNHQTDFKPYQQKMGLNEHFTSVTGNEVTTKNGHFNSFPLPPGKDIPPYKEDNWVKLVDGIRAKGAKVVILNHPRWPDIARGPFGRFGLNRASGDRASGGAFTFDALELINSGTLQPDPLFICRDWFALLNHGERITAVGSSDSHTVGNVVGQGRTYVPSSTDDPSKINVDEMCEAFLQGRTTISLGIILNATVNGVGLGELVQAGNKDLDLETDIRAPSWVKPRKLLVFINGEAVMQKELPASAKLRLPAQAEDGWLVCVVIGDGVKNPAWAIKENYTFAATNPIYLDVDGDGQYTSPRDTASARLKAAGNQWQAVEKASDPIAMQMVALLRLKATPTERQTLDERIRAAAGKRKIFSEFLRYAPKR